MGKEALDTTLDELIKSERSDRRKGRGRGMGKRNRAGGARGRGGGRGGRRSGGRRGRGRTNRRPIRNRASNIDDSWQNDRYNEMSGSRFSPRRNERVQQREPSSFTTKSGLQVNVGGNMANPDLKTSIQINGLHSNVSQDDLMEILSKYGALKYAYVMYKDDGKTPTGSGRACFQRASNAREAVEDLKDATIDGVSIRITFLGDAVSSSSSRRNFRTNSGRNRDNEDDEQMEEEPRTRRARGSRAANTKFAPTDPVNPLSR